MCLSDVPLELALGLILFEIFINYVDSEKEYNYWACRRKQILGVISTLIFRETSMTWRNGLTETALSSANTDMKICAWDAVTPYRNVGRLDGELFYNNGSGGPNCQQMEYEWAANLCFSEGWTLTVCVRKSTKWKAIVLLCVAHLRVHLKYCFQFGAPQHRRKIECSKS